jgi:hypothetical protein
VVNIDQRFQLMPLHNLGSDASLLNRCPMPEYRIYMLTAGNEIAGPGVEVDCQSDDEAVTHARGLLNGQDLEIWSGTRIVTRLPSAGPRRALTVTANMPS